MTNPYESPSGLQGSSRKSDRRLRCAPKAKCAPFLKSLILPKSLAVIVTVAVAHVLLALVMPWFGLAGYRVATVTLVLLGLPLVTPVYAVLLILPVSLSKSIPQIFGLALVGVNSLIWGIGVLCFLRAARRLRGDRD